MALTTFSLSHHYSPTPPLSSSNLHLFPILFLALASTPFPGLPDRLEQSSLPTIIFRLESFRTYCLFLLLRRHENYGVFSSYAFIEANVFLCELEGHDLTCYGGVSRLVPCG